MFVFATICKCKLQTCNRDMLRKCQCCTQCAACLCVCVCMCVCEGVCVCAATQSAFCCLRLLDKLPAGNKKKARAKLPQLIDKGALEFCNCTAQWARGRGTVATAAQVCDETKRRQSEDKQNADDSLPRGRSHVLWLYFSLFLCFLLPLCLSFSVSLSLLLSFSICFVPP